MKEGGDADAHATKLEFRIGERVTFHPDWRQPVMGMITRGNLMYIDFSSIHNHHEKAVFEHVMELAPRYPSLNADLLVDAACIALNKLKAHYIRHDLDLNFYMPDIEREQNAVTVRAAVEAALTLVQSRGSMKHV